MKQSDISLRTWGTYGLVALLVLALDQVSKYWAVMNLTNALAPTLGGHSASPLAAFLWQEHPLRTQTVEVLANFWHFRYVENPGAAWSFFVRQLVGVANTVFAAGVGSCHFLFDQLLLPHNGCAASVTRGVGHGLRWCDWQFS